MTTAFLRSRHYHSSPSLPQFVDEVESLTPSVSTNDLDGGTGDGASGEGGMEHYRMPANSVYWASGGDDMRYETSRYKSFGEKWPHDFLRPENLAKAGFYYLNAVDTVQCPFCGLKLDSWDPSQDPMKEHRLWQPCCPFVLDIPCGNVVAGYHIGNDSCRTGLDDSQISLADSNEIAVNRPLRETASAMPALAKPFNAAEPRGEEHRMGNILNKSTKYLSPNSPPPNQQYGLHYNSSSHFARRMDWARPRTRSVCVAHEKEDDYGSMMNETWRAVSNDKYNNSSAKIQDSNSNILPSSDQSEPQERPKSCVHVGHGPDVIRANKPAIQLSIPTDMKKQNQIQYNMLHDRLESFSTWPSASKQMPYVLAEAGFYYSGVEDITVCFSCCGALRNWVKGADPWVEHARWYSGCPFLRMMKGDPFVTWVVRNKPAEVKPGKVRPYMAIPNNVDKSEKNSSYSLPRSTSKGESSVSLSAQDCYDMGHKGRGKFLIFKNDQFENNLFLLCKDTHKELQNLTNAFAQLNFEVYLYENLTYDEIISVLKNVAQEDHSNADCFGLAIFTRGEGTHILAAKDRKYHVSDLCSLFCESSCHSLVGKPKLFFFNVYESSDKDTELESIFNMNPLEEDFLLACASWNDNTSWEDSVDIHIQRLCEELRISGDKGDDFLSILKRVGYSPDSNKTSDQMCVFQSSLTKKLYFIPKDW